jgi:hypothetical protein
MRLLLIIVLIAVVAIALVMIARPSGPRVTRIEHRREDEEEDRE